MIGIFVVGCFITLIVVAAIAILVLGHRAAQADLEERKQASSGGGGVTGGEGQQAG